MLKTDPFCEKTPKFLKQPEAPIVYRSLDKLPTISNFLMICNSFQEMLSHLIDITKASKLSVTMLIKCQLYFVVIDI